jgi:hypothetical protein
MIRCLAILLWPFALVVYVCGSARADVDGSVPSPGSCAYPAVGTFGAAFGEYDFACQFPVEENGSRHTTLFGGGMWSVSMQAGVSFMFVNASVTATSPVGVLRGITYWACPDLSMAGPPNPPGAWKSALSPRVCKSIAPRPELLRDGMPPPPPGAPAPPPLPSDIAPPPDVPPAPPGPLLPNQTNPGATQPFQPEEPQH